MPDKYDAGPLNHFGGNVERWFDYIQLLLDAAHDHYEEQESDAVEQEREACAGIVRDAAMGKRGKTRMTFLDVEREIRARGDEHG